MNRLPGRIPLWVDLRHIPVNKRLPFLHAIDETAALRTVLEKDDPHHQRDGLKTVWLDGHHAIREGKTVIGKWLKVSDGKAVERAAKVEGIVVVDATDWKVIPLENLIAARQDRPGTLFAVARSAQQAALFAQTLEHGVDGIVLSPAQPQLIYEVDAALRHVQAEKRAQADTPAAAFRHGAPNNAPTNRPAIAQGNSQGTGHSNSQASSLQAAAQPRIAAGKLTKEPIFETPGLVSATITAIEDAGLGDRVCIDTTSLFRDGEGLLVGSTAASFALVHAETLQSGFIATRPFRVNAGAVHSYLYGPDGKTRYLSELAAGQTVQALHHDGTHRRLTIGRVKVERRPHLLVKWTCADGVQGNATLQNAETIRLITPDGTPIAVTDLKVGSSILVHNETAGRHTGIAVAQAVEER